MAPSRSGPERLPNTVYLRFGNQALTFTDDIILDQTKPTITSAIADASNASPTVATAFQVNMTRARTYKVRIGAKDATSGVAKMQFAAHGTRHPSGLRKFERVTRYKGTRAPEYVRVQDRAGNFSRWHSTR